MDKKETLKAMFKEYGYDATEEKPDFSTRTLLKSHRMPSQRQMLESKRRRELLRQEREAEKNRPLQRSVNFNELIKMHADLAEKTGREHGATPDQIEQVIHETQKPFMDEAVDKVFSKRRKRYGKMEAFR